MTWSRPHEVSDVDLAFPAREGFEAGAPGRTTEVYLLYTAPLD